MSVFGSRFSRVGDAVRRRDLFDLQVLACRVVALALDVGFPGVRGRQHGVVRALELGQVPAQPLTTADDASPAGPDDDKPFSLKGLQARCGLSGG